MKIINLLFCLAFLSACSVKNSCVAIDGVDNEPVININLSIPADESTPAGVDY